MPFNDLPEKKPTDKATRNASAWRFGGYDKWKEGDAEREKELPVGGIAPIRPEPDLKPKKPMKTIGQRLASKF
jgi:hypothetical protein